MLSFGKRLSSVLPVNRCSSSVGTWTRFFGSAPTSSNHHNDHHDDHHHHHYDGPKSPGLVGKPGHLEKYPEARDTKDPSDPYGKHGSRSLLGTDSVFLVDRGLYRTYNFHIPNTDDAPKSKFLVENGQKFVVGEPTQPMEQLYNIPQHNIPMSPRRRLEVWANDDMVVRAEFIFFYIPIIIICALVIPSMCMIYMNDEAVFATMTVKVIGRQWYWVYEVESPIESEDDEDDE